MEINELKQEFNKFIEEDDEINEEDNEFKEVDEKEEEIIKEFSNQKEINDIKYLKENYFQNKISLNNNELTLNNKTNPFIKAINKINNNSEKNQLIQIAKKRKKINSIKLIK